MLSYNFMDLLDVGVLISFGIVFLCESIAKILRKWIESKCEDAAKLTIKYSDLVNRYNCDNLIQYVNKKTGKTETFPVVLLYQRNASEPIRINDNPEKFYKLPKQVADNSERIMHMYAHSVNYNQINIRLEGLHIMKENGVNNIILDTSRTFYFDSLRTNRACDCVLPNGNSIREIYEPGPYVRNLGGSKLSNHLGFNGFVITKDKKIPFVLRGKNVNIGKGTLGDSIGASLKAKYALSPTGQHKFTEDGMAWAIVNEIIDELGYGANLKGKKKEDCIQELKEKALDSIIAFYRDLVEAGKPQFLFCMELDQDEAQVRNGFEEQLKKKADKKVTQKEKEMLMDGTKLFFFSIDELKNATITAGELCIERKESGKEERFRMMPSASASIVMLLEYLAVSCQPGG